MHQADTIRANLHRVLEAIDRAARDAGRDPASVRLVGVTKYVGPELTAELLAAGCEDLGESRPQSLWDKAESPALAGRGVRWHLIGHMQRNKVARTLTHGPLLHSLDSERLIESVNAAATAQGRPAEGLLEVNTSGDPNKDGLSPDATRALVDRLDRFPMVRVRGLMTMASGDRDPGTARRNFAALRALRDALPAALPGGAQLRELSMGMSGDFVEAVAEGATMVRIGSALWDGVA